MQARKRRQRAWRGRALALALALALVAAACGDAREQGGPPATNPDGSPAEPGFGWDEGGGVGPGGSGAGRGTPTSAPAVPGQPGGGPGSGSGSGSGSASGSASGSGGGSFRSSTTTTAGPGTDAYDGARRGPGAFARTLLRPQPATRLVVELLVQSGAEPAQGSIDHLVQVLGDESRKQVTVAERVALPAGDGTTTADDIRQWSDQYGRRQQGGNQAVVRLLFLRGRYHEPTPNTKDDDGASALGVAVRGDTMAVFKETVRSASSPLVGPAVIEDAVVTHELGHLLGLVDLVLDTGREDPEHPGHSPNRESVMYWAVESDFVLQALGGPPPRHFDSSDRSDLATIRSGA